MEKPLVHPNFAQPSSKTSSPSPTSPTSTSTTATAQPHKTTASTSTSTIQYDHETYLELLAGESNSVEKTASQVYEEKRARERSLRAQDPAVLSGPLELDVDAYQYGVDGDDVSK